MGCRVVTTDNVNDNPGHMYSDISYSVDTTDKESVLEIARKENIDGVIAPCTDVAVSTASYVSEKLKLPGINTTASNTLTRKILFRAFQSNYGLPYPDYLIVKKLKEIPKISDEKWIVKPNFSSGSKGVFIVSSNNELEDRLPETFHFCSDETAIIEKVIVGEHFTIEGILRNGGVEVSFILKRKTAREPYVTTIGHYLPAKLEQVFTKLLYEQIQFIFNKLDVRNTVFDCDFILSKNKLVILEISPRLGGNAITNLIEEACGFNLAKYAVQLSVGLNPVIPNISKVDPTAVVLFGVWESGILSFKKEKIADLIELDWVKRLDMTADINDWVKPFINGRNSIGMAIISAPNFQELVNREKMLNSELNFQVMH